MTGLKLYPQLEKFDLSNSVELSVNDFFPRRMRNREKEKVMGKRCEILSADTNFIYFGYPYPYTGNGVGKADTIFKTQTKVLTQQFSSFKNIEGYHVKNLINKELGDGLAAPPKGITSGASTPIPLAINSNTQGSLLSTHL